MITVAIKNVRQSDHATFGRHSQEEVLIFRSNSSFVVATHGIKGLTTKHRRAMGKWDVAGTTYQPPAVARTHNSPAGVNSVAERSNNGDIRSILYNLQLPREPIGMRDVVSIHPRHDRSSRL